MSSSGWDDRRTHEPGPRTDFEHRMRSMRRWRYAISGAAVALGVVLVVTGHVLVGVVIGGLAAARLVMFARFPIGRAGTGRPRPRPEATDANRQWLRSQARDEFLVAAGVIGCTGAELRDEFQRGRSIAEVASERSVGIEHVTAAIAADVDARARAAQGAGTLSADDAQQIRALAPRFADRLVHGHRGEFRAHA